MANLSRKLAAAQNKRGCFPSLVVFFFFFFKSWGWWVWSQERRLFYSWLAESISGGSLAWVWPEVWRTPTRGRPHEQAQGKGRESHLCDIVARARLLSHWPPLHHLPLNHVIWMRNPMQLWFCVMSDPCLWFAMLIQDTVLERKWVPEVVWIKVKVVPKGIQFGTIVWGENRCKSLNRTFTGFSKRKNKKDFLFLLEIKKRMKRISCRRQKILQKRLRWLGKSLLSPQRTQWRVRVGQAEEIKAFLFSDLIQFQSCHLFSARPKQSSFLPCSLLGAKLSVERGRHNNKRTSQEGSVSTTREEKGKIKASGTG